MLRRIPVAPSSDCSSSGDEIAARAASTARFSPRADADTHEGRTGVLHDRAHVGEVEVDQARHGDEVGDPLHALAQDVVGHAERLGDGRRALDDLEQPVVLDDDQRVDAVAKRLDPLLGLVGAQLALEPERTRHDADGERADLAADLGDDGRSAGSGAAALARGDEDHVRALERFLELVATLLRGGLTDAWVGSGTEPSCCPSSRCGSSRRPRS